MKCHKILLKNGEMTSISVITATTQQTLQINTSFFHVSATPFICRIENQHSIGTVQISENRSKIRISQPAEPKIAQINQPLSAKAKVLQKAITNNVLKAENLTA